jgi:hypothetical protein
MKTYYKFRPRAGETSISYDMIHPSGVVVDGFLTFLKENGKPFIATFEATSAATAAEVRFRLQQKQLVWDAIAMGSLLATVLMLAAWLTNFWDLTQSGWLFSIALPVILTFLGVIAYQMLFRGAERYRYIYAIEQFKQYHADEQWIALGKDVFDNTSEADFAELRDQCVKNGFGLVTVDGDEHVNLLITPAREEVFGKKRHTLKFADTPSVKNVVSDIKRLAPQNLERYQQPYLRQLAMTCGSVVLLSGLFYRSWTLRPVDYVGNEKMYQDSMAHKAVTMVSEPSAMVYNPEDVEKPTTPQPYEPTASAMSNPPKELDSNIGLYVYTLSDGYLTYDCARIDMRGTKYVVQDHVYNTFDDARRRIEQLKTQDLIGNAIFLTCTSNATTRGYCVYYGDFFNDVNAANQKANDIKKELTSMSLANDFIQIRVLQF